MLKGQIANLKGQGNDLSHRVNNHVLDYNPQNKTNIHESIKVQVLTKEERRDNSSLHEDSK